MNPDERLLSLLRTRGARFRLFAHEPEGVTIEASRLRGHPPEQAAKCMVVRVKTGRRNARYILTVVPGDCRVDLGRVRDLFGGTDVALANADTAESLTGTVCGAIMPFAFHEELHVVADPDLLEHDELYFNAGRLDLSVALNSEDYVAISNSQISSVAQRMPVGSPGGA